MKLAEQTCKPVQSGAEPLSRTGAEELLLQAPAWTLEGQELKREFRFRDFRQAMRFTNKVADLASEQDHHPDIFISYSTVRLVFTTHKIKGLSLNDFIMAAKVDLLAANEAAREAA